MGYRYLNYCVDTEQQLYDLVAANCPTIAPDGGTAITCTSNTTDVNVIINTIPLGTPINYTYQPALIACDTSPAVADIVDISWKVALVWVTAWAILKMAEAMKR